MRKIIVAGCIIASLSPEAGSAELQIPSSLFTDADLKEFTRRIQKNEDLVVLVDGSQIGGKVTQIPELQLAFGKVQLPPSQIAVFTLSPEGKQFKGRVITQGGESFEASLEGKIAIIETETGKSKELDPSQVRLVLFHEREQNPPVAAGGLFRVEFVGGDHATVQIKDRALSMRSGSQERQLKSKEIIEVKYNDGIYGKVRGKGGYEQKLPLSSVKSDTLTIQVPTNHKFYRLAWKDVAAIRNLSENGEASHQSYEEKGAPSKESSRPEPLFSANEPFDIPSNIQFLEEEVFVTENQNKILERSSGGKLEEQAVAAIVLPKKPYEFSEEEGRASRILVRENSSQLNEIALAAPKQKSLDSDRSQIAENDLSPLESELLSEQVASAASSPTLADWMKEWGDFSASSDKTVDESEVEEQVARYLESWEGSQRRSGGNSQQGSEERFAAAEPERETRSKIEQEEEPKLYIDDEERWLDPEEEKPPQEDEESSPEVTMLKKIQKYWDEGSDQLALAEEEPVEAQTENLVEDQLMIEESDAEGGYCTPFEEESSCEEGSDETSGLVGRFSSWWNGASYEEKATEDEGSDSLGNSEWEEQTPPADDGENLEEDLSFLSELGINYWEEEVEADQWAYSQGAEEKLADRIYRIWEQALAHEQTRKAVSTQEIAMRSVQESKAPTPVAAVEKKREETAPERQARVIKQEPQQQPSLFSRLSNVWGSMSGWIAEKAAYQNTVEELALDDSQTKQQEALKEEAQVWEKEDEQEESEVENELKWGQSQQESLENQINQELEPEKDPQEGLDETLDRGWESEEKQEEGKQQQLENELESGEQTDQLTMNESDPLDSEALPVLEELKDEDEASDSEDLLPLEESLDDGESLDSEALPVLEQEAREAQPESLEEEPQEAMPEPMEKELLDAPFEAEPLPEGEEGMGLEEPAGPLSLTDQFRGIWNSLYGSFTSPETELAEADELEEFPDIEEEPQEAIPEPMEKETLDAPFEVEPLPEGEEGMGLEEPAGPLSLTDQFRGIWNSLYGPFDSSGEELAEADELEEFPDIEEEPQEAIPEPLEKETLDAPFEAEPLPEGEEGMEPEEPVGPLSLTEQFRGIWDSLYGSLEEPEEDQAVESEEPLAFADEVEESQDSDWELNEEPSNAEEGESVSFMNQVRGVWDSLYGTADSSEEDSATEEAFEEEEQYPDSEEDLSFLEYSEEELEPNAFHDLATEEESQSPGIFDQISESWAKIWSSVPSEEQESIEEASDESEESLADYPEEEFQPDTFNEYLEEESQESEELGLIGQISESWARIREKFLATGKDVPEASDAVIEEPAQEESERLAALPAPEPRIRKSVYLVSLNKEIPGIYIDQTKVSNSDYQEYLVDTDNSPPIHWTRGNIPSGCEDDPVVNISYEEAEAYAKWAGKRLPREEEWLRGQQEGAFADSRDYINEWTATPTSSQGESRANPLLAGKYRVVKNTIRDNVNPMNARECNAYTGFRCVADVK